MRRSAMTWVAPTSAPSASRAACDRVVAYPTQSNSCILPSILALRQVAPRTLGKWLGLTRRESPAFRRGECQRFRVGTTCAQSMSRLGMVRTREENWRTDRLAGILPGKPDFVKVEWDPAAGSALLYSER